MGKTRLEAFSDGMFGIFITVMVLGLSVPHEATLAALRPLVPGLLSYVLSFCYIAIYWNNHHHMLHAASRVDGSVLWANMHLLFWISLIPFATAWMGQNHFARVPTAVYGVPLLMAAIAYWVLQWTLVRVEGAQSHLAKAIGGDVRHDLKGQASMALYAVAIPAAFLSAWIAGAIYVGVALLWVVPDRRIERLEDRHRHAN